MNSGVLLDWVVGELDSEYTEAIGQMKRLALGEFGCLEFFAMMEGSERVAISYWESEDAIANWKRNLEHVAAQRRGREKWYKSYSVQVAEIRREYSHNRQD